MKFQGNTRPQTVLPAFGLVKKGHLLELKLKYEISRVCYAVTTKCHILGGINNRDLFFHFFWRLLWLLISHKVVSDSVTQD